MDPGARNVSGVPPCSNSSLIHSLGAWARQAHVRSDAVATPVHSVKKILSYPIVILDSDATDQLRSLRRAQKAAELIARVDANVHCTSTS